MPQFIRILTLISAVVLAPAAFAHNGEDHSGKVKSLKGTVQTVGADKIVVKATDGKAVDVLVDDKTKYESGGTAAVSADLQPGTRVVVHGHPMKDGTVHATKVRFGKQGAKPAPSAAAPAEGSKKKDDHAHGDHKAGK